VIVVGAGIVGLATALHILEEEPGLSLLVVDKEREVGAHQTSHNSGVIHRGIYYVPGSLKAQLCVEGARRLTAFCDERGIPYRLIGKLIVATGESELPALRELQRRGEANGVPRLRWLDGNEIREIEPHAVGVAALHSPETGIVDFGAVVKAYATEVERRGGMIRLGARVTGLNDRRDHMEVRTEGEALRAAMVVTCGGLQSDRLAAMTEPRGGRKLRIVPFRGDYYFLRPSRVGLVRGLIYPVPDARFPFLGVHFTPRMDGGVWLGPNAVLAFAREGYRLTDFSLGDLGGTLAFPGFWRLAARYWRTGAAEMWRDLSRRAFARALQRYVPALSTGDLVGHASGVRAQAVASDGSLVDDFTITGGGRVVHVRNAPSPAATSSLAIGEVIGTRVLERLSEN
jgi:L-2-hydroxyglutarate oxidase LhgO